MSTAAVARPVSAFHSNNTTTSRNTPTFGPKKSMSITQTYYLAHKARAKLSREAAQPDHDLRLLVGHANMLDSLMIELAEAEREQERWFNQSVRGASSKKHHTVTAADKRHVQWADRIEESEEEFDSDSSDSDSDDDMVAVSAAPKLSHESAILEDEEDDDEEDFAQLELVRTPSHSSSPPELVDHDFESSDDESGMPPSPTDPALELPSKDAKEQPLFEQSEFYAPRRPAGLVSSVMVY